MWDSEIAEVLRKHEPTIRVMEFIGQSSIRSKGLPQREQARIVKARVCMVNAFVGNRNSRRSFERETITCWSPLALARRDSISGRSVVLLSLSSSLNHSPSGASLHIVSGGFNHLFRRASISNPNGPTNGKNGTEARGAL